MKITKILCTLVAGMLTLTPAVTFVSCGGHSHTEEEKEAKLKGRNLEAVSGNDTIYINFSSYRDIDGMASIGGKEYRLHGTYSTPEPHGGDTSVDIFRTSIYIYSEGKEISGTFFLDYEVHHKLSGGRRLKVSSATPVSGFVVDFIPFSPYFR